MTGGNHDGIRQRARGARLASRMAPVALSGVVPARARYAATPAAGAGRAVLMAMTS